MAVRDRDTNVFRHGITPETMSVISTKNKIYAIAADDEEKTQGQIGVLSTFDPSESRTIETVRGIGFGDHVAELVPGLTEPMTISVTRTAQYLSLLWQVFGYKGGIDGTVRSLRHHKWPFDLRQELVMSNYTSVHAQEVFTESSQDAFDSSGIRAIVTLYEGCWFSDFSTSYAADTALVIENGTINITDIIATSAEDYAEDSPDLFNIAAKSVVLKLAEED